MDIDGAKALKDRLARTAWARARPASIEVPDDAPPVYHWFSVGRNADGTVPSFLRGVCGRLVVARAGSARPSTGYVVVLPLPTVATTPPCRRRMPHSGTLTMR